MRPGLTEILIIVGVLILFFGATRIPDLARSMGEGIRNFKKGLRDEDEDPDKLPEGKGDSGTNDSGATKEK